MKKISYKIFLAITLTCFILTTGFGTYSIHQLMNTNQKEIETYKESLLDDYDTMIKNQVETAVSLLTYAYNRYASGELTEKEAKEVAINLINSLEYGEEGYFWIDDVDGYLIAHPVSKSAVGTNRLQLKDPNGVPLVENIIDRAINQTDKGYSEYMWEKPEDSTGTLYPKRVYSSLFTPWQWVVSTGNYIDTIEEIVQTKENEYGQSLNFKIVVTIVFVILSTVLTLIIATLLSKLITKPITKMVNNIKQDEHGNISIKELEIKSKDEIGELGQAINAMLKQVTNFVTGTKKIANKVTDSSVNLLKVATERTHSIEAVSRTMEEFTQGVSEQADATQKGSENLNVLAKEINTVVENAQNVRNYIIGADKAGKMGLQAVNNLKATFTTYDETIHHLTDGIEILVGKSASIGTIIEAIQGIAEQTNLLALNASIEAARAGEAGRGFSVVAEEIRKLAEGTTQSAKQIGEMVGDIQEQVKTITCTLDETKALFNEVDESISHTGNAFGTIEDAVVHTNVEVDQLLGNTDKMSQQKEKVIQVIEYISATAEESAASSEEISASLEEQTISIEEISNTAKELENISSVLQEFVHKFSL
jgi:methyl-accepting chemotaxis protein